MLFRSGNNKITGKKFKITDYENLINQFKKQFQIKLPNRSVQFFRDEILWLLDMNITKEEYLTDNRIGRAGTRLKKGLIVKPYINFLNSIKKIL